MHMHVVHDCVDSSAQRSFQKLKLCNSHEIMKMFKLQISVLFYG